MTRALLFASAALVTLGTAAAAKAPPFETPAPVAFLIDLSSGAVLLSKDADRRMPPWYASRQQRRRKNGHHRDKNAPL